MAVSLLPNGMLMMWQIQLAKQDDAEFIRRIHPALKPVTGLKCSCGKILQPLLPRSRLEKQKSREPSQPAL